MSRKKKKEYSLDELGEMILPGPLTDEDRKIFREAIENHKKKMKLKKARASKRKVTS